MANHAAGGDSSIRVSVSVSCDRSLVSNVMTALLFGPIVNDPSLTPTLLHRRLMHPLP